MVIYEVDPVVITDGACYTMTFHAKTSDNTWGLKAGTTEQAPVSGTGDVFVAHSYTNTSGNKRWIFVNNSDGSYLAYHGQTTSAFDVTNAINEWDIQALTAGSGNVSADAPVAGKLCITNDKRYTDNTSKGCYIVNESTGDYDNSDAPYYNGEYTSALEFTATGDAVTAAASLAIAKFDAIQTIYAYENYVSALFPADDVDENNIIANINAATTEDGISTALDEFWETAEGRKFHADNAGVSGHYLSIGESYVTGTNTSLVPDDVMEVEYAGNGKYYLKGVKYATYARTPGSSANISTISTQGSAETFYIVNRNNDTDNKVYFSNKKTSGNNGAIHYSSGYTYHVVGWTWDSDNSQWNINAITDEAYNTLVNTYCDVTYNAILEASGTVEATATTLNATRGVALSAPVAVARDYCTMTYYSDATCTDEITTVPDAATATVYVLVTDYDPPFTLSASYETATWYYATLRGTKYVRANESAKDGSGRYTTNTTNEKTDVYKWAFVGTNPYDLTIMNRGAGSSKVLYAESTTVPTMKAGVTPASDSKARWTATPNSIGAFALRNESGATLYINDSGGAGNLGFWNSTNGTSDAGSNWVITEVPTVDVTYEFVVGESTVNTIVVKDVPEYAEVDVPAGLTTGYSTFAYDFETSGTIEGENCTITVTGTMKSGLVKVDALSNSKKYKLTCPRGSLSTYTDGGTVYLASPCKTALGVEGKKFAILNYNGAYYLYSVDDEQFVTYNSSQSLPLKDSVCHTTDKIAFTEISSGIYAIKFNNDANKFLNSSANYPYGIVVNDYGRYTNEFDDGNQYVIEEIDDFVAPDCTSAFNQLIAYESIIAQLEAVNWGLTSEGNHGKPNYYNMGYPYTGYSGNEVAIIAQCKDHGYNGSYYNVVQGMPTAYSLNMPTAGKFYRIQGSTSSKYLASGLTSSKFSMTDATDATTIFYYDGTKLTNLGSGMCNGMTSSAWEWVTGDNASVVTFQDGLTNGGYAIKSATDGNDTNKAHFYDNGDAATNPSADRGGSVTINASTNARYTNWYLTEMTTLPIAIGSTTYATLYAPVALTIPEDVKAYYINELTSTEATLTEITTTIHANTPVILKATAAGTYNFAFADTEGTDVSASNKLAGQLAAFSVSAEDVTNKVYYTLQRNRAGTAVGLFPKTSAGSIAGFKAYLPAANFPSEEPSSIKGFTFVFDDDDDPTGINAVNGEGFMVNGPIYNLAGQRIQKMQKGINIVNGKKILY